MSQMFQPGMGRQFQPGDTVSKYNVLWVVAEAHPDIETYKCIGPCGGVEWLALRPEHRVDPLVNAIRKANATSSPVPS